MRIQFASDLHVTYNAPTDQNGALNVYQEMLKPVGADYLVLAGDIGELINPAYKRFLDYLSTLPYKHIFIVPGNHEYYGVSIEQGKATMEYLAGYYTNITFHDNDEIILDGGVRILATTLWSNVTSDVALARVNDFIKINSMTKQLYNDLNNSAKQWLRKKLSQREAYTTIIVTHHAPSPIDSIPQAYINSVINECFINYDLDDVIQGANYWIHGHSHKVHSTRHGQCLVLANTLGCKNECPDYNPGAYIDV